MDSTLEFQNGQYYIAGKRVAELRGDVVYKTVRDEHMLQKPRKAWACDAGMLFDALQRGAHLVEVRHQVTGQIWRTDLALFFSRGWAVNFGSWGEQRALALEFWQTGDAQRPPAAVPVQLAFGW